MGRASNRKKAQRHVGPGSRRASQDSRADAVAQRMADQLAGGLRALVQLTSERVEREAAALPAWRGAAEPVSAETPQWPEGSLGDRFLAGTYAWEALDAPCLLTAKIPDATVIAANPAHWNVATSALVRAVIFDGLALDHPAVSMLLEVLAPIAEVELVHGLAIEAWLDRGGPYSGEPGSEFPEEDGPVYLLGGRALVDAVRATLGEDLLSAVLGELVAVLDGAVPGLDGQVAADALIGALAAEHRCDHPGDGEVLKRIGRPGFNPLETLVANGAVPPADVLPAGLKILSALAQLCQSGSASVLHRHPEAG